MTEATRKKACIAILVFIVVSTLVTSVYFLIGRRSDPARRRNIIAGEDVRPRQAKMPLLATIPWKRDSDEYQPVLITPPGLPWSRTFNDPERVEGIIADLPWRREVTAGGASVAADDAGLRGGPVADGGADVAVVPWAREAAATSASARQVDGTIASLPWAQGSQPNRSLDEAAVSEGATLPWEAKARSPRPVYLELADLPWRR